MFPREPSDSAIASADYDGGGDLLPPGADPTTVSRPSDGERDRTKVGGGKRTTGAGGVSVIVEGDGESNGSLGDGLW